MEKNTIEIGSPVRKKLDGPLDPLMTVESIDGDTALCTWTDALGSIHSQDFPLHELTSAA